jgi:hypothetical protein
MANGDAQFWNKWASIAVQVVAFIVLACVVGILLVFVIEQWNNQAVRQIVMDHLRASVGLPIAGVFAFLVVALFRSTEGQIEFEILTVKFKGAAGPIIMWIFCFLSITLAIRVLWPAP